jgi:PKD repeat protein
MKKGMYVLLAGIALLALGFQSCKKVVAPTAEIFFTIDNYSVTFNPQVTDADTYAWDFGDGSAPSAELNPVHVYESFGDYTVTLVVTGPGGDFTATKTVSIAATSLRDLLTGGINATNGKTWVFDRAYTVGEGGGPVQNAPYTIAIPSAENVLDMFGLGDEYDNEFTFYFDGDYQANPKNGNALAGAVYGYATGTIVGDPAWAIGLCAAAYSPVTGATWEEHETDMEVEAIDNPDDTNNPPVHHTVTITGKKWVSLSDGSYFGILDFPTTARFVIDDITSNRMVVSLLVCGYSGDAGVEYNMMPSNMFHLVYVTK